jgi:hypothetical protein
MLNPESRPTFKPSLKTTLISLAVTAATALGLVTGYRAATDAGLFVGDGQTHHYDGGIPRYIFSGKFSQIPIAGAKAGPAVDDVIEQSGIDQKTVINLNGCEFSFYHDSSYTPLSRAELEMITNYIIGDGAAFFSNYRLPQSEDMFIFRAAIPKDQPEDLQAYLKYQTYTVPSGEDSFASHVNLEAVSDEGPDQAFPRKVQEDFMVLTELIQSMDKALVNSNSFAHLFAPEQAKQDKLLVENTNNSKGLLLAAVRNHLSYDQYEKLMQHILTRADYKYALIGNQAAELKTYSRPEYESLVSSYPR